MTSKQMELVKKYKRYEEKYGEGNVFIFYCNKELGYCIIYHIAGEKNFTVIEKKINGRILNNLDANGYFVPVDNLHNIMNNANDLKYNKDNYCIGAKLIIEIF